MRATLRNSCHEMMVNIIKHNLVKFWTKCYNRFRFVQNDEYFFQGIPQPALTCSKSTTETPKQYVKFFTDNNKDTITTSLTSF